MWTTDRLLPGYRHHPPVDGAEWADGEPNEPLTATVRRNEPSHHRAVLYIHGWNDYFFQTHMADFWNKQGSISTRSTCVATAATCAPAVRRVHHRPG